MAKRVNDGYEYKEAPMRQALEYASFGWLIGKRSEHYSSKYNQNVVTLRRDFAIGADPTIKECEKEYLRLEKGKIPRKYKEHAFFKGLGKLLVILIIIGLLLSSLSLIFVGVYGGLKTEKRVRALYNTAVEAHLTDDPYFVDVESGNGSVLPPAYIDFVTKNPSLDTYEELVLYADGRISDTKLENIYKSWLYMFDLATYEREESFAEADPTLAEDYVSSPDLLAAFTDAVKGTVAFINFDRMLESMPIWLNTYVLVGAGALVIFIIMVIVCSFVGKKKKKAKRQRCVVIMRDCLKKASDALYELKSENRELMTRKDAQLYELENMFSKMVLTVDDEFE